MYSLHNTDTICALATTAGGALGIVRISGRKALEMIGAVSDLPLGKLNANTVNHAFIRDGAGEVIDEVVVSVFRAPHSYTGEDSVEISCHGSRYILNKVLELLISHGCRMALPGEFTQRAFINGKMDLSQAEAVADLIASRNQATHHMAMTQMRGTFSSALATLREKLLKLTSLLELELDFSDHEDLEFADRSELQQLANDIDQHVLTLAHSFEKGQALKEGIPVAIVGKTNVGKSTLLNCLLKDNRAIVSDIHGTTRDTIEDTTDLQGVTFRFIDTAGIRQTADTIEQIGINRTYTAISKARIVIWIIDQEPTKEDIKEIQELCNDKSLIITHNKIDKQTSIVPLSSTLFQVRHYAFLRISAKHNLHIDELKKAIYEAADLPTLSDTDVIVTSARHYDALLRAHNSLQRVIEGLSIHLSGDLISEDLRDILRVLAEITGGEIVTDEVLGNIFQHFCVGK